MWTDDSRQYFFESNQTFRDLYCAEMTITRLAQNEDGNPDVFTSACAIAKRLTELLPNAAYRSPGFGQKVVWLVLGAITPSLTRPILNGSTRVCVAKINHAFYLIFGTGIVLPQIQQLENGDWEDFDGIGIRLPYAITANFDDPMNPLHPGHLIAQFLSGYVNDLYNNPVQVEQQQNYFHNRSPGLAPNNMDPIIFPKMFDGGGDGDVDNMDPGIPPEIIGGGEDGVEFSMNTNTILYGPPGTGKTHSTIALALSLMSAGGYHDANDYAYAILNDARPPLVNDTNWRRWTTEFEQHRQAGRIEFTTFHQNYAYEDFIEGLKAETNNEGGVTYSHSPGILKRIAYRALHNWLTGEDLPVDGHSDVVLNWLTRGALPPEGRRRGTQPTRPYLLIIDEINRGNVARIFGELITLVEDSKRAKLEVEINVGHQPIFARLPYTKEPFILPPNLYFLGTMNTADRSLIGLDAALRRRFEFVELAPKPELLETQVIAGINLMTLLERINSRIVFAEKSYDHQIGHSYFLGVTTIDDLANVMKKKVIPQLNEYFFDSPEKIAKILLTNTNASAFVNEPDDSAFVNKLGRVNSGSLRLSQNYIDLCNCVT